MKELPSGRDDNRKVEGWRGTLEFFQLAGLGKWKQAGPEKMKEVVPEPSLMFLEVRTVSPSQTQR